MHTFRRGEGTAGHSIVRWELPLLVLLAPFFLFPSQPLPLLILPVLWITAAWTGDELLAITPLNASIALLAVMVLVSVFVTYDLSLSLPKITGVVFGIGLFFALVRLLRETKVRLAIALHLFSICGGALAVLGLLGTQWIGKVSYLDAVVRRLPAVIRGIPGQAEGFSPNAVAGALLMFLPLQILLVFARRDEAVRLPFLGPPYAALVRVLHAWMLLLTASMFVLSQSRGAWLAAAVSATGFLVWNSAGTRKLAVVLGAVFLSALVLGGHRIAATIEQHAGANLRLDIASRLELWDRALTAIGDFPITGMGLNTFRRVVHVLYPPFLIPPDVDVAHAHNHLLQVALDLGLPGLIAYLAIWLCTAAMLRGCYRSAAGPRAVASALGTGLLAYFVFGTADVIALGAKLGMFLWVALALVVCLHSRTAWHPEGAE